MTSNWKDTLTNHQPAYQASDWQALKERLNTDLPASRPWLAYARLAVVGIVLFGAGFLFRGWFDSMNTESKGSNYIAPAPTNSSRAQNTTAKAMNSRGVMPNASRQEQGVGNTGSTLLPMQKVSSTPVSNPASSVLSSGNISHRAHLNLPDYTQSLPYFQRRALTSPLNMFSSFSPGNQAFLSFNGVKDFQLHDSLLAISGTDSLLEPTNASDDAGAPQPANGATIGLTLRPFYQLSGVKKDQSYAEGATPAFLSNLNPEHEIGVDMHIGNYFFAGVGFGYHFWSETPQPRSTSKYRAQAYFARFGATYPLSPKLSLMAHVGVSWLFSSYTFQEVDKVNGVETMVPTKKKAINDDSFYGIGIEYDLHPHHSLYGLAELGGRNLTIGYKYRFTQP